MAGYPTARPAALCAFLLLLAQTAVAAADGHEDVVAQFGATRYTQAELNSFVHSLDPATRRQALGDPQLMNRLVQLEIIRKAILSEARNKNWQKRPDVAKEVAAAADAIIVKDYLAAMAPQPGNYPSAADIQKAYDLNRDRFLQPRQYHLQQIFIAAAKGDPKDAAARQKAVELAARLQAGAKFEVLARTASQHQPSAKKGGDMGWAAESQLLPEIREIVAGMAKGETSAPIRSGAGWHVVRLLDTKPAAPRPLAEVRPLIVASLRQTRQQQDEQLYIARMLQKTPVTLNQPLLRKGFAAE